jgi:hypothetical protein
MDRPQMAGLAFAVASAVLGTIGLVHTKPLPLSARLGQLAPMDANNDGRLSALEWTPSGRARSEFEALDTNRNAYLEPAEVKPRRGAGPRK